MEAEKWSDYGKVLKWEITYHACILTGLCRRMGEFMMWEKD